MIRAILVSAAITVMLTAPAFAQSTSSASPQPAAVSTTSPGPLVTTGSGRSYSRHGTIITTGSGRTVSIGRRSSGLAPVNATSGARTNGK